MAKLLDDDFLRRIEQLEIASRKIFRGRMKGERRSKSRGQSSEFADYRTYVEGDDLRFIDWNIYGRLDRLLLRLFEEEEDLSIYILLDASRSMTIGEPRKLDYAMKLAAALTYVGLANLDRVSIVPFSDRLHERLPPGRATVPQGIPQPAVPLGVQLVKQQGVDVEPLGPERIG